MNRADVTWMSLGVSADDDVVFSTPEWEPYSAVSGTYNRYVCWASAVTVRRDVSCAAGWVFLVNRRGKEWVGHGTCQIHASPPLWAACAAAANRDYEGNVRDPGPPMDLLRSQA